MQTQSTETTSPARKAAIEPFIASFRRVAAAWLVGFAVAISAVMVIDPSLLVHTIVISVASGLIAVAALCPLILFVAAPQAAAEETDHQDDASTPASSDWVSAFMLGTVLRLFGTVALFLLCRYQLGQQPEAIAVLVGGWYVLLTSVEVVSLAKTNTATHRSRTNRQIWTTG